MQDVHLCMYVCMYGGFNLKVGWNIVCMCVCMYVYMCVCIYVSQGDFRLMSFTAGRCGTPLIPNDQLRRNGVRSSDLIPNDQLRRNGVRSSDLIVCVSKSRPKSVSRPFRKPIATNPDRRTSEASPPVSDRKPPAAKRSEVAGVGPKGLYEPIRTDRSVLI